MLFKVVFLAILFYQGYSSFIKNIELYFLIYAIIAQIFNPTAELTIPT